MISNRNSVYFLKENITMKINNISSIVFYSNPNFIIDFYFYNFVIEVFYDVK